MRVMVKFWFPNAEGNELTASGKIGQIFQQLAEDLKPEAAYFYPDDGERAGHFIVDVTTGADVALTCERLFHGLHAKVELVPVMTAEDLQMALSGLGAVATRYA
ncbi:MAG: hypothetical protein QOF51_894 [Chloroflexota bacterium]|jgi:hypothetical protein|nr:hypothetical protein [Chloroflexota bacterium]